MRHLLLSLIFFGQVYLSIGQEIPATISQQLLQFEGKWELISSSLEMEPAPPKLDTSLFSLTMECSLGQDSLSIHCQYSGSKEIIQYEVKSFGQELMVYEPEAAVIYKLSGIRNRASQLELNGMFVTIGKGKFGKEGQLELTEYLAGQPGPVGIHTYEWMTPNRLIESSTYMNEKGEKMRSSSWIMRKISVNKSN